MALYASKHNPFLNFTGTQGATSKVARDSQLATDAATGTLATFGLVVPGQCHDMHGTGGCGCGCGCGCGSNVSVGHVATIVIDNKDKTPTTDGTAFNHYSLLGSMEAAFGLAPLAHAGGSVVRQMVPLLRP